MTLGSFSFILSPNGLSSISISEAGISNCISSICRFTLGRRVFVVFCPGSVFFL